MRADKTIILDQARLSRERAAYYRRLARTLTKSPSVSALEKSACDLEQRAREIELYAKHHAGRKKDRSLAVVKGPRHDPAALKRNVVGELQVVLELALSEWKHGSQRGLMNLDSRCRN